MIQIFVALVLIAFALWLIAKAGNYLISFVSPPKEIVIVPFEGSADQKATAQAILSSKLRSLGNRSKDAPAGYGLFSLPLLNPEYLRTAEPTNAVGVLDDIEFKIKDVNIGTVVKAFNSALSPSHYELRGSVSKLPGSTIVACKLVWRDSVLAGWESEIRGSPADELVAKALDDIVYQMIYDFVEKEELRKRFGVKTETPYFKTWRGLQSYINGLSAFRAYQLNLDTNDLDAAYAAFDRLVLNDSEKSLGLYFRGLVLSEKRKEAQAVDDFERLQRLLQQEYDKLQPAENSRLLIEIPMEGKVLRLKQMLYEAKLNEATARLKLYNWQTGEKAVETLKDLVAAIRKDLNSENQFQAALTANDKLMTAEKAIRAVENELLIAKQNPHVTNTALKSAQEKWQVAEATKRTAIKAFNQAWKNVSKPRIYLSKLLVLCEAQLGYTHSTILSFLRDKGFTNADRLVHDHIASKNEAFKQAEYLFRMLVLADEWSEREKRDARFRISNARGYGLYRQAYFLMQAAAEEKKSETYRTNCAEAIKDLEEARENRPDHYEVLQNLGMIYTDEDYDGDGHFLLKAQDLFELTKRYVPDDYYQYEQLALIHWRRAAVSQNPNQIKIEIDQGRKDAIIAQEKRAPEISPTALRHLSRFTFKEWEQSKFLDNKEAIEVFQAFKNASTWHVMDQNFFRDYTFFLSAMAQLRENSATGLVEVVEHTVRIVRNTKDWIDRIKSKEKPLIEEAKVKVKTQSQTLKEFADGLGVRSKKLASKAKELRPDDSNKEKLTKEAEQLNGALNEVVKALDELNKALE